ncbi:MAG: 50S ribosomal protein L28 [Candidatus Levybacteria bacterium]|nr:50S ribosomal protein L28 [Candidatus Levybacteria bacterium]
MTKGNKCDNCGKGIMYGHNVSHAKNRTRKIFKPNLHRSRVKVSGVYKTMRLCTKCLRLFKAPKVKSQEVIVENQPQVTPVVA